MDFDVVAVAKLVHVRGAPDGERGRRDQGGGRRIELCGEATEARYGDRRTPDVDANARGRGRPSERFVEGERDVAGNEEIEVGVG